jgi:HEAT repeat protein
VFTGATEKVRFIRALKDLAHEGESVRNSAANTLGNIHHALSVRALCVHLASEPCAEVRKECVNSLTGLESKDGRSAVERALSDRSSKVRLAAVRGIYRLAGPESAPSLIRMLSDENEDVRRRAAACTGWLRQKHLAVDLQPLLHDNSPLVRIAALEALGNLKSSAVLSEVIELLNDPEERVRKKAFEALRAITGNQMAKAYPEDENERQFLIARWRVWQQEESLASCEVLT